MSQSRASCFCGCLCPVTRACGSQRLPDSCEEKAAASRDWMTRAGAHLAGQLVLITFPSLGLGVGRGGTT
jgi:hypothetical protein